MPRCLLQMEKPTLFIQSILPYNKHTSLIHVNLFQGAKVLNSQNLIVISFTVLNKTATSEAELYPVFCNKHSDN